MELVFGAGKIDRRVPDVEGLLVDWREKEADFGQLYLEHEPVTPRDRLFVEDLAATVLVNSRVAARAATSVCRNGESVDLRSLPEKALEETTREERQLVADVIGTMTSWPWVGASLATKTLHLRAKGSEAEGASRLKCVEVTFRTLFPPHVGCDESVSPWRQIGQFFARARAG